MTETMNKENAEKNEKLKISNKKMYEEAKKEVTLVTQVNGNKEKYIKRVKFIDKKTGNEIATKNSLLGIKKGKKMIFGTDKIEEK